MKRSFDFNQGILTLEKFFTALSEGTQVSHRQRLEAWKVMSYIVNMKSTIYFRKARMSSKGNQEWHNERVLLLFEFIKENTGKRSIRWCLGTWRRRFAMFEAYRQLRMMSVHLEGSISYHTSGTRILRDYVRYCTIAKTLPRGLFSDVEDVVNVYRDNQRSAGKLCGDKHIKAFFDNCFMYRMVLLNYYKPLEYKDTLCPSSWSNSAELMKVVGILNFATHSETFAV